MSLLAVAQTNAGSFRLIVMGKMDSSPSLLIAFAGARRVASGPVRDVLTVLKQRFDRDDGDMVLVFEVESGRQIDFDLRGSLEKVLARHAPDEPARGPGRPRLGVVSREVSLLPRHWEWLEDQPTGTSGAMRRLVEQAAKSDTGRDRARRTRAALYKILSALAGDLPHFEEASRALFAGDTERFRKLVSGWPRDVRDYAVDRESEAARADAERAPSPEANADVVRDLHRIVWSLGDYDAVARLVAERYVVHSDPGDAWEGRTLDRATYVERVRYSRVAFPDLSFVLDDVVAAGSRVAVRWHAEGTHEGDLRELPATGRRLKFAGQTFYEVEGGKVAGHWQVIDRLGFVAQLRA